MTEHSWEPCRPSELPSVVRFPEFLGTGFGYFICRRCGFWSYLPSPLPVVVNPRLTSGPTDCDEAAVMNVMWS